MIQKNLSKPSIDPREVIEREGARALTGWTLDRQEGTATFVPRRHDAKPKTVLGRTANLDATGFVGVLLDQPTSAPFVATRWWRLLAGPTAPRSDELDRPVVLGGIEIERSGDDVHGSQSKRRSSVASGPVELLRRTC